jgi:hypothetical protein
MRVLSVTITRFNYICMILLSSTLLNACAARMQTIRSQKSGGDVIKNVPREGEVNPKSLYLDFDVLQDGVAVSEVKLGQSADIVISTNTGITSKEQNSQCLYDELTKVQIEVDQDNVAVIDSLSDLCEPISESYQFNRLGKNLVKVSIESAEGEKSQLSKEILVIDSPPGASDLPKEDSSSNTSSGPGQNALNPSQN